MPKRHAARQRVAQQRQERAAAGEPRHGGPLARLAEETLEILRAGSYASPADGRRVNLAPDLARSVEASSYHPDDRPVPAVADARPTPTGNVRFELATSFGAARRRLEEAAAATAEDREPPRVCVLNFASAKHPGGGFRSGAVAQEEILCRASGLYPTLTRHMGMYGKAPPGLYTDRMIYSPAVPVFRDDQGGLLPRPVLCDVVSAAACNLKGVKGKDAGKVDEAMQRRARKVLALAQAHGATCVVLGAWGTGVFRNDAYDVAEWFQEALQGIYFDEVVFAIPDGRKLAAFEEVFEEGPEEGVGERGLRGRHPLDPERVDDESDAEGSGAESSEEAASEEGT